LNKFYARDGQFWLDDQPQLIHAAEFHYFRTPKEEWPQRLDLLKSAGFNTVAAYIPWLWHQLEENLSDVDGHSHPMRDLAGFLDLAAEETVRTVLGQGQEDTELVWFLDARRGEKDVDAALVGDGGGIAVFADV
jgi:beta-galactosidase